MKKLLPIILILLLTPTIALSHSGGTDSNGGHHDYNHVSGLGDYHYHHGYGPHLHPNGICPYEGNSTTPIESADYPAQNNEETYTMTESELETYVYDQVSMWPDVYNVVPLSDYEALQSDFESYQKSHPESEPFGLTEYFIIGIILFALIYSYYSLYKWGANHKAQLSKKFDEGYDKGYTRGYHDAENKEVSEGVSNALKE